MAIEVQAEFPASIARVWSIVGMPDRVDWVPGAELTSFDGEVRRFALPGAGQLAERILCVDNSEHRIEYTVIESDSPLQKHVAAIKLQSVGNGTRLIWTTEVEPVAVEKFIKASMQTSITAIQQILAQGE